MRKPRRKTAPTDAYGKGLGLLSRREHSARELKAKLARKGHARDEIVGALDKLIDRRYQSDDRFAVSMARTRAAQGYGPARIRAELKSHGLADAAVRAAIASTEADWTAIARHSSGAASAHGRRGDREERGRRAQFLLRRGFDPATVRAVTRAIVDDPGEEFD